MAEGDASLMATRNIGAMGARHRGMTLIEVMVALGILTMMVVSVWSGFEGTVKAGEISDKVQSRYQSIRSALNRMAVEIPHAYLSYSQSIDEQRHFTLFDGQERSGSSILTFSSFAHLRLRKDSNEGDQSLIQYFVARDPEDSGKKNLYRRETRRLTGDLPEELERFAPAYILCEDVDELHIEYWDEVKEEWRREWATIRNDEQPDRLPERVRIELVVKDDEGERQRFFTQTVLFMNEKLDTKRF